MTLHTAIYALGKGRIETSTDAPPNRVLDTSRLGGPEHDGLRELAAQGLRLSRVRLQYVI